MEKKTKKRALCVGINKYENYPRHYLSGCVNDVETMKNILVNYLDFDESEIVTLTDDQATKAEIMSQLKSMVDDANNGIYDSLVYSHSGHGTVIPTTDPSEHDGLNEAFCPYDLAQAGDDWDPEHIIQDDEFFNLFSTLNKKVSLEVFLDTCHSGTGLRLMDLSLDRYPKFIPAPTHAANREIKRRMEINVEKKRMIPTLLRTLKPDDTETENKLYATLWAACKADQTSADAYIDGDWHGAFTYYFEKSIDEQKALMPRKTISEKVTKYLADNKYTQIPQLELNPLGEIEVSESML